MLAKEENDYFTRVGPGAPGEMLRRYWHPIGFAAEVKKRPIKRTILGEDLVLFRDDNGRYGLLQMRCSHRGTSLEFGHVEDGGLRWCYKFRVNVHEYASTHRHSRASPLNIFKQPVGLKLSIKT